VAWPREAEAPLINTPWAVPLVGYWLPTLTTTATSAIRGIPPPQFSP
jgi:hypothetical protein